MTQSELILAALKAARQGSRELDVAVALASGLWERDWGEAMTVNGNRNGWVWRSVKLNVSPTQEDDTVPPRYTTVLDHALSLLPAGWDWELHSDGSGAVYRDVPRGMLPGAPGSTVISFCSWAPPLGVCIGALLAIERTR